MMFGLAVLTFLLPLTVLCQEGIPNLADLPPGLLSTETLPNFDAFRQSKVSDPFYLNLPDPILAPEKFAVNDDSRNFPKEAADRGLSDTEVEKKKKRESESDSNPEALPIPESEAIPLKSVQSQDEIPRPSFPDTNSQLTPLDFKFADPSLKNYPPPELPSAAVRSLSERKKRQAFPNFSQISGSSQNFGNPVFPDTQSELQSSSFNFPDIMSQPFQIPVSIQQQFNRRKRQAINNFPNFSQFSQSVQPFGAPAFPNTQTLIGDLDFFDPQTGGKIFSEELQRSKRQGLHLTNVKDSFPNFLKLLHSEYPKSDLETLKSPEDFKRPKRGHRARQNSIIFLDDTDSLTAPFHEESQRPNRNALPHHGPVRYPPYDPFGNIQYIPLPPSNPHFALPVTHEDPHMFPLKREKFRRPYRNINLNTYLKDLIDTAESENFIYESSQDFQDSKILSVLKNQSV